MFLFLMTIGILWFISAVFDYHEYCYWWQLKEYRQDKFRNFLSTREGKHTLFSSLLFFRLLCTLIALLWPVNTTMPILSFLFFLLCIDIGVKVRHILRHQFRRPIYTLKTVTLIFLSILLEGATILTFREWPFVFLLMSLRLFIMSIAVLALSFPTRLVHWGCITTAERKMRRASHITVIGITGSFGKTTVKVFLAHILGARYRVYATPGNINTEIGIARELLRLDLSRYDILVIEMGAYRMGEIKAICSLVKPTIGILTAINQQHVALFGTIKDIQTAKYELFYALPKTGFALTNSDNPYCRELLPSLSSRVETFGTDETYAPAFFIKNIASKDNGSRMEAIYRGVSHTIFFPFRVEHFGLNIAPCAMIAWSFGMSNEEIQQRVSTLDTVCPTLQCIPYGTCTIIDDSYNANPDGFKAALNFLSSFPSEQKRIVVTRGILELGSESTEIHKRLGEEISFVADELVVISRDCYEAFQHGIGTKYKTTIRLIEDPTFLLQYFRSMKEQHAVILVENRLPSYVGNEIFGS